jgi:hypothetical protein
MSNFTPGPWKIVAPSIREPHGVNGAKIWGANDAPVCQIPRRADRPLDRKRADLNLIAAAPEIYEALRGLLAEITEYQTINSLGGENNHWQDKARAALAKAKGEQ